MRVAATMYFSNATAMTLSTFIVNPNCRFVGCHWNGTVSSNAKGIRRISRSVTHCPFPVAPASTDVSAGTSVAAAEDGKGGAYGD